jgi:hypothetical protein
MTLEKLSVRELYILKEHFVLSCLKTGTIYTYIVISTLLTVNKTVIAK